MFVDWIVQTVHAAAWSSAHGWCNDSFSVCVDLSETVVLLFLTNIADGTLWKWIKIWKKIKSNDT